MVCGINIARDIISKQVIMQNKCENCGHEFNKGDIVYMDNGIKVNGVPIGEIAAEVERVAGEHVFLLYPTFKYVAHIKNCKKVMQG